MGGLWWRVVAFCTGVDGAHSTCGSMLEIKIEEGRLGLVELNTETIYSLALVLFFLLVFSCSSDRYSSDTGFGAEDVVVGDSLFEGGEGSVERFCDGEQLQEYYFIMIRVDGDIQDDVKVDTASMSTCDGVEYYPELNSFGFVDGDTYIPRPNEDLGDFLSGEPDVECSNGDYAVISNKDSFLMYSPTGVLSKGDVIKVYQPDCSRNDYSRLSAVLVNVNFMEMSMLENLNDGSFVLR